LAFKNYAFKKLKLGLDLQGGLHLVMGVEVDKVALEYSDRVAQRLNNDLVEKKIIIKSASRVGETTKISIKYNNINDAQKIKDIVSKYQTLMFVSSKPKELIYDIKEDQLAYTKRRAVEQTIEAIRNRIDEFGVNEPSIQTQGSNRILIQLPGVKDPSRAKSIIGRTARLEFKIVKTGKDFSIEQLNKLISDADSKGIKYNEKESYSEYIKKN
jgi:preprotein translocase subunit SecD